MKTPKEKASKPFTLIIFGASGSLAKLKLFPSIYELAKEKRLPKGFQVVGYARTHKTRLQFQSEVEKAIKKAYKEVDSKLLKELLARFHYVQGQYDALEDFQRLKKEMKAIKQAENALCLAYFSTPPSSFSDILKNLAQTQLSARRKLRLILEKPFGHNLSSAKKLKKLLLQYFEEKQIFLLDHYLGKEAVSNLLSLRDANPILSTLFNAKHVSNIQITAMEQRDIEGRANYFDNTGVIRDMLQSHLTQVLTYLSMSLPETHDYEAILKEKLRILRSIRIEKTSLVRAQYQAYRKEAGVSKDSQTETYAALKVTMKHPMWKGVPMYLRTGKALKKKWTAVVIEFKAQKEQLEHKHKEKDPNRLVIQLQPQEKIEFHLLTKLGGQTFNFQEFRTGQPIFCSGDCLSEHGRLLLDVLAGDRALFLDFREVFQAWKLMDPLQKHCKKMKKKGKELLFYKRGSLGPKQAEELPQKDGHQWFNDNLSK